MEGLNFDINSLPQASTHWRPLRIVVTLVAMGALTYGVGKMFGVQWASFHHHLPKQIVAWKAAVIAGSLVITVAAVSSIFWQAIYGRDKAAEQLEEIHGTSPQKGRFWGDKQWKRVSLSGSAPGSCIVDTSTLVNKTGICFAYQYKPPGLAEVIAFESAMIGAPFGIATSCAYNALRLIASPFIACRNNTSILREAGTSLFRLVSAPFYGVAYFLAQLWVFIDPPNGRKIAANISRNWNHGTLVDNGCSLAGCWHRYRPEKDQGFKLFADRHEGFYIQLCFQPCAVFVVENGGVTKVTNLNGYDGITKVGYWAKQGFVKLGGEDDA